MYSSMSFLMHSFAVPVLKNCLAISSLVLCLFSSNSALANAKTALICTYDGFLHQFEIEIDFEAMSLTQKGDLDTHFEITLATENYITAVERGLVIDGKLLSTLSNSSQSWLIERSTGRLAMSGFGGHCLCNGECKVGTMKPLAQTGSCSRKVL